jgi:hypothetical protein
MPSKTANPDTPVKKVRFDPVVASVAAEAVWVVAAGVVGGVVSAAEVKFRVLELVIPVKALSERSKITPLAISM